MKKIRRISLLICLIMFFSALSFCHVSSATTPEWATNTPALPDYDYSFAVLGDTQNLMKYDNYDNYHAMYDWIIENKDSKKIKFVMGLGDITEYDKDEEWQHARQVRQKLCQNGIMNSFIRGNHDLNETRFNKYFPYSEFGATVTGAYQNGNMLNTYTKFTAGNVKYIVFALTVGPSDDILNWVGKIAEQNPDHNIIITTHVYLTDKGTHTSAPASYHKKYYGVNGGEQIWNKLASKHENIVMVLSGHYAQRPIERTQIKGKNGNVVTELMIDAELPDEEHKDIGGLGLVAMFYFSNNGKRLDIRYYSTVHDKYYMNTNQFSYELNVVGVPDADDNPPPETSVTTSQTTVETPATTPPPITTPPATTPPVTDAIVTEELTTDAPTTTAPLTDAFTTDTQKTDTPKTDNTKTAVDKTTATPPTSPNESGDVQNNEDNDSKRLPIIITVIIAVALIVSGLVATYLIIKKKR